jgi:hypothetical protein
MLTWRWFPGAGILVAGILLKMGAPVSAVVIGLLVAAFATWQSQITRGGR